MFRWKKLPNEQQSFTRLIWKIFTHPDMYLKWRIYTNWKMQYKPAGLVFLQSSIGLNLCIQRRIHIFLPFTSSVLLSKLFWPNLRKKCFSDREKLEIRRWRLRFCKIFGITRTIYSYSERSEQFFVTECFFNSCLFLKVSHI